MTTNKNLEEEKMASRVTESKMAVPRDGTTVEIQTKFKF